MPLNNYVEECCCMRLGVLRKRWCLDVLWEWRRLEVLWISSGVGKCCWLRVLRVGRCCGLAAATY